MPTKIRTLLVDDHKMFREALRLMLDKEPRIQVVGEIGDGAEVEAAVASLAPDVVVMDVSMPHLNGIDATRELLARHPQVHVLALSAFGYNRFIMEMLEVGASGYVVKSAAGEQLVQAIVSAAKGQTYLCPEAAATLVEATRRRSPATTTAGKPAGRGNVVRQRLGRRETEVLRLLAEGRSSPQIAVTLNIATSTVDVHRRNIMRKLELRNVADLTRYAIRIGLVSI